MLARPDRPQPARQQGLQAFLQAIIGAQVIQIASLQAQLEDMQAEIERLRGPAKSEAAK